MSDVAAMLEKADWVEELQKKVFEECAAHKSKSSPTEDSLAGHVPISIIISNVHRSFAQVPLFRFIYLRKSQRSDFLEELRKSLHEVGRDDHVNWYEFRESSERWFLNLVNLIQQDGNNNIRVNHSDAPAEDLERDGCLVEGHSGSDANYDDPNPHSINQLDTIESCYSLNSSSMGFGTTDSMMESSEETDHNGDIAGIDLEVRIRRYNEETARLREDLLKAEEIILNLERELMVTKTALERMTNRFNEMKKENDEQKELLNEAERRNDLCKQHLRKLEKAQVALEVKSRELDVQKENIAGLKTRIDEIMKENSEYVKQLTECRVKYDEKLIEYEYLQEKYEELDKTNCRLEKSFERNILHHKEKIQELQNQCADLQSKMNGSDTSSRFSLTPPPYGQALTHVHSTPYSNRLRSQDSLFNELRASGYNIDEAKVQDLKQELSFYNEEIALIAEQVDEALQEIATSRNEICVPNVQLVESDSIQILKQKITALINLVKDYTSAPLAPLLESDSPRQKPDILPELKETSCLADDRVFAKENREHDLIGSVTTTIPSITLSKINDSCSSLEVSVLPDDSENSEQEVIVPIDEALSRINELKEADEEGFKEKFKLPSRIRKPRATFTLTRSPAFSPMKEISTGSAELPSDKEGSELKANTDVYAMGDGPHIDLIRKNNVNNTKPQADAARDIEAPNSECKPSPHETFRKLDTRYVTIRPSAKTYVMDGVVSSTVEKFELGQFKLNDVKPETMYYPTPTSKIAPVPRRKLSVYHRSFDVDSLQTPESLRISEKRRSISTPDVQESEFPGFKAMPSFDASVAKSQLLSTYRCANSIDNSSCSPSSANNNSSTEEIEDDSYLDEIKNEPMRLSKPLILAPTKFKLPDSTANQTVPLESSTSLSASNKQSGRIHSDNCEAHQSKILSGSLDILKSQLNAAGRCNFTAAKTDLSGGSSSKLSTEQTNSPTADVASSESSIDCWHNSGELFVSSAEKHKTYTKKEKNESSKDETKSAAPSASSVSEAGDCSVGADASRHESSGAMPAVKLVMSSGEDSSAESECEPRQQPPQQQQLMSPAAVVEADEKPPLTSSVRPRSNSCVETLSCSDDDNKTPPVINGDDKESSCQKIKSHSLLQEITTLDESPKAFPSLTDQKLREAGISNFNDIETEIKESLSEEELKEPPRQRNSVSGRVPTLRRPSLSYDPRYEIEKLDRTDSSSSITELREINEQSESRRHSREENNNSIRASSNNLAVIPHESIDDQIGFSNAPEEIVPELEINNDSNSSISLDLLQNHRHPLVCQLISILTAWKPMLCGIFIAFFIGFFCNRVISSSKTSNMPNSWWSIEEILNQYAYVENGKNSVPRPV